MMDQVGRFWRTVRHLTFRQLTYQALRLRGPARLRLPTTSPEGHFLVVPNADKPVSWAGNGFTFLNQPAQFQRKIDWNYAPNGKLWTYHLNYFDFLNQPGLLPDEGLRLIRDFIDQSPTIRAGLEPYPTSLRIHNWVQFLSRHRIQDVGINAHLFAQTALLRRRLEYHLAGNHLLENGLALLTGALYFQRQNWFQTASPLIRTELTKQILADGGHDERSPTYHHILLDRLLNVLLMLRNDTWHNDPALVYFLEDKTSRMQDWLLAVTFSNGDVPMVNDGWVVPGLAGMPYRRPTLIQLSESGYRMFRQRAYELFMDVGPVGPDHQPGHAHADTFSFVLYVGGQPVIVDAGTSTYATGPRRTWERSTAAHNTVEVGGQNSSEVWAGFRVGRRARVKIRTDTDAELVAWHDGYRPWGITHERTWSVESESLRILDRIISNSNVTKGGRNGVARFHFHPAVDVKLNQHSVITESVRLSFESKGPLDLRIVPYELADGFNRLLPGQCLEVRFVTYLETTITLTA